jgi:hypothetical protein
MTGEMTKKEATPPAARKIEMRQIADLKPHPKQAQLFGHTPRHQIEELAADIRRNGQLQPGEVLPDNTLLAGHNRAEALRLLGRTEMAVWVRDDLANDPVAAPARPCSGRYCVRRSPTRPTSRSSTVRPCCDRPAWSAPNPATTAAPSVR